VQLRSYSPEILAAAEKAAFALYDEFAAQDADFKTIYDSWKGFRDRVYAWNNLNEASFANYSYSTLK
jgi:TRAP-type mannitol/chloroaromatic compound transport system substrate-binding protein